MSMVSYGVPYAANYSAQDSKELQILFGTRISEYVLEIYRQTLNLELILRVDSNLDLCQSITYLCEDSNSVADMMDTALDGGLKEHTLSVPRIKTFHGFRKGGFRYKLAVEQLECITQNNILRDWFNSQLAKSIEAGRQAIMARWYRELIANVHPKNTGNDAGMLYGRNVVGSFGAPVLFNPRNADKFFMAVLSVIKQMPKTASPMGEWNRGIDADAFIFGPSIMENVLMQSETYLQSRNAANCACTNCALFKDVFSCHPRGILPITGDCIESYTCVDGGSSHTVYPVLFGRRFLGAKASLRIKTHNWMSQDEQSVFYQTLFYHHMHVYDNRFLGLGYIVIDQDQPEVIASCTTPAQP